MHAMLEKFPVVRIHSSRDVQSHFHAALSCLQMETRLVQSLQTTEQATQIPWVVGSLYLQ